MASNIEIQIERSLTNTPTSLLYGEPAWDDANEKLYVGNSSGTPVLINPGGDCAILQTNEGSDDTINYNQVADTRVTFSTVVQVDADFTWSIPNNQLTCNFDGKVIAGYHIVTTSTGNRNSVNVRLIRQGVSTTEQYCESYTYIRNNGGHTRDAVSCGLIIDVQDGDTLEVSIRRHGNNTAATNLTDRCEFFARRLN